MAEKIFYYCQTGIHASVVSAAIHLGLLNKRDKISSSELLNLPHFDNYPKNLEKGNPIYLGRDKSGSDIYTFPVGNENILSAKAIRSLMRLFNISKESVYLVDASKCSPSDLKIGLFLLETLKLKGLGRSLIIRSIMRSFNNYLEQVERIKQYSHHSP